MNSCVDFEVLHYTDAHSISVFYEQFPFRLQSVGDLVRKVQIPCSIFCLPQFTVCGLEDAVLVNELFVMSQGALIAQLNGTSFRCVFLCLTSIRFHIFGRWSVSAESYQLAFFQ